MALCHGDLECTLRELPTLASGVVDILSALDEPVIDYHRLEARITADPAIASNVLQLANSSFYGFAGGVASIRKACVVLGVQTLRMIITTVAAMEHLPLRAGTPLDQRQLWRHSIGVAAAARAIAEEVGVDQGISATAGLLHDMGKLALNIYYASDYEAVVRYREQEACTLREAEMVTLGVDNSFVGTFLAEKWQLPDLLIAAIGRQHRPGTDDEEPVVDVIHVANAVARALAIGDPGDDLVTPILPAAWQRLGLTWPQVARHFAEIEAVTLGQLFAGE